MLTAIYFRTVYLLAPYLKTYNVPVVLYQDMKFNLLHYGKNTDLKVSEENIQT
jgi:hypothetical protein